MNKESIYNIMKTKCISEHHLKRYVNFIFYCVKKNYEVYEKHHILPRGKSFWPEFSSFKENPWNKAMLTPRQHFIAHHMLAKALGGGMWFALLMMCKGNQKKNKRSYSIQSKLYEKIKIKLKNQKRSKEHSKAISDSHKGYSIYKDSNGNKYWLNKDDSKIYELNLVGHTKGSSYDGKNLKGKVSCIDLNTNKIIRVDKRDFDSNQNYVGINYRKESSTKNTIWVKKDESYKMVKIDEVEKYLNNGWIRDNPNKGVKNDYLKNTIWMTNDIEDVRCSLNEQLYYEGLGFRRGRKKFKERK